MVARVLAGAVVDSPMVRKWLRLIRPLMNKPEGIKLRRAATGQRMPMQQIQSPDFFIWLAPNTKTIPEDWRRYELKINDKNWITNYKIMIDPNWAENKLGHYEFTRIGYNWKPETEKWDFKANYHNRVLVSNLIWDYNKDDNKYQPLEDRAFIENLRDIDTDEDIKAFNKLYK